MTIINEIQERAIKHALTAGRGFVYRNHYICEYGTNIFEEMIDLCQIGFARQVISPYPKIEQCAFVITRKGAHAVGLHLPGEKPLGAIIKADAATMIKRIESFIFKDQSELLDKGFFGVAVFGFALLALVGLGFLATVAVDGLMILWSWIQ